MSFENIDSNSWLIIASSFVAFAATAWLILESVMNRATSASERLVVLSDPRKKKAIEEKEEKKAKALSRALERASPALSKPLTPNSEEEISRIKQDLSQAGFRGDNAVACYLSLRAISALAFLTLGGGASLFMYGMTYAALVRTFIIGAIGFYLPTILLKWLIRRRKTQIFLGLPDALDLLVVCVEAGLGLDHAMRRVAEEMKKSYPVIADEFALCNLQLQMGRSRTEVLADLGARTGVEDVRSLASILIQATRFGSSIAQALRVQSDAMRTRRQQIAEEKAAKTAVKLIFPLVLFIFPGIFVVLVGPAGIQMAREMFPAMSGN